MQALYKTPAPMAQSVPCAPTPKAMLYADTVDDLRDKLAEAEAVLATENARCALAASLNTGIRLYDAAVHALHDIRAIECDRGAPVGHPRESYAEFRRELTEMVAPFGYKVVLVGDKTKAMLVKG